MSADDHCPNDKVAQLTLFRVLIQHMNRGEERPKFPPYLVRMKQEVLCHMQVYMIELEKQIQYAMRDREAEHGVVYITATERQLLSLVHTLMGERYPDVKSDIIGSMFRAWRRQIPKSQLRNTLLSQSPTNKHPVTEDQFDEFCSWLNKLTCTQ